MLDKIAKAFTFLLAALIIDRFLFERYKDRIVDTVAGIILLGDNRSSDKSFNYKYYADMPNFGKEIANIHFEANMEIGIKQKSRNVGQILDYIRLSGKNFFCHLLMIVIDHNANISAKIYQRSTDLDNSGKDAYILMNITFNEVNRSISQNQKKLNNERCGSINWIYFTQIFDMNDTQIDNDTFTLRIEKGIGIIEVDRHQYDVDSKFYLKFDYDLNDNRTTKNRQINNISFDIFLKEIVSSYERNSISEFKFIPKDSFYNIHIYTFILLMICL